MTASIFLPGILMPARVRYTPLLAELSPSAALVTKELEVYTGERPPDDYSLSTEVDGLDRFATEHGYDAFHLYGHSIGATIALAYAAAHPDKVASLALDEPATDFSDADRREFDAAGLDDLEELPEDQRLAVFARTLVRPGVELGPPPASPPDPEMAKRPGGLAAVVRPVRDHRLDHALLKTYGRPVYYSYGSLSHARWEAMAARLHALFVDCTVERYEGLHHLNTSHQAEPARVASALRRLRSRAGDQ